MSQRTAWTPLGRDILVWHYSPEGTKYHISNCGHPQPNWCHRLLLAQTWDNKGPEDLYKSNRSRSYAKAKAAMTKEDYRKRRRKQKGASMEEIETGILIPREK